MNAWRGDQQREEDSVSSVLLINQYFWPDLAATAQLLGDLAEDLANGGWHVTALCSKGQYFLDEERRLQGRERWKGVDIRRAWSTSFGRTSTLGRLLDYISFLITAGWKVLLGRRYEVVVCLSTPPLVALLGLLARHRGSIFVYKVEDLYPDVAIALGKLSPSSWTTRYLRRISTLVLEKADAVVALDRAMAAALRARGAKSPAVIPNWADGRSIYPSRSSGSVTRARFNWEEDEVVILYSGNLGLAHRFDVILAALRQALQKKPTVRLRLVFVGGGPRWQEVFEEARDIPEVELYPYRARDELQGLYNAADIHLVSLRDEVSGLLVPSKYAAALAAGKPVLLLGGRGSDMATEIESRRLGWVCNHNVEEVEDVLINAASCSALRLGMAKRSRECFERRYDRMSCFAAWERLLTSLVSFRLG